MLPFGTISAKTLDGYVGRQDAVIIDLRERKEYLRSHVKGAVNIPYETWGEGRSFPENKILVFYCDRGGASMDAARRAEKNGYRALSVIGGFEAYRGKNLVSG